MSINVSAQNKHKNDSVLIAKQEKRFNELFIQANFEKNQGDYAKSLAIYKDCLVLQPKSAVTCYKIAEIYFETLSYNDALLFAKKSVEYAKNNEEYRQFLNKIKEEIHENQ